MKLKKQKTAPKYKLVIFDFDGTLADSVPSIHKTANQLAKLYGSEESGAFVNGILDQIRLHLHPPSQAPA